MKNNAIFLFLTLVSCSAPIRTSHQQKAPVSKLVFKTYTETSERGWKNVETSIDSMIALIPRETELDPISLMMGKKILMDKFRELADEIDAEEIVEIQSDTIWRYKTKSGEIAGDKCRIDLNKELTYYYSNPNDLTANRQFNLFDTASNCVIQAFPKRKKKIMGYSCYMVVIRKEGPHDPNFPLNIGDTFYEMYVTKALGLPVQSIFHLPKNLPVFFPLAVRSWHEKWEGITEVHEIKKIEYKK